MNWKILQIYIDMLNDNAVLCEKRIRFDYEPNGATYDIYDYPQDVLYLKYRIADVT